MKDHLPLIPSRYYLHLLTLLSQRNIPLEPIYQIFDISLFSASENHHVLISMKQVEQIIEYCLGYPQNADLAFDLGRCLKLSSHSLLGFALMTSATVGAALNTLVKYFRLVLPSFRLVKKHRQGVIELSAEPILAMSELCLNFHLEAIAIAFLSDLNELLNNQLPACSLYVSYPEPAHANQYSYLKQVDCHFGWQLSPSIRFVFDDQILQRSLPMADYFSFKIVEQRCQDEMRSILDKGEVVEWVKMMLRSAYQIPTLLDCAQLLNISTKTLQRYLKLQQVEFNQLRQEVIVERATKSLDNLNLTIAQISYELGYSNPANFTRAFQKVMQMSPTAYRQQQKVPQ